MRELFDLLVAEIRGAWRFRWRGLAVAWLVCMLGWGIVLSMPNIYQANAQVFVDAQSRLAEVMGQVGVAPGVGSRVFVVRQAMLGKPQLERVASETGLIERARTDEEREELYEILRERIQIGSGRTSQSQNLYTITFEDYDRDMAVAVVQRLLGTFVEDVLKLKEQGTDDVDVYLTNQLNYYSNLLSTAESKLANFKKKYVGLLPGESGGIFERLQVEMSLLRQLKLDLQIEVDRREELRRQLQTETPFLPDGAEDATGVPVSGAAAGTAIKDLERKLSDLLLQYTDRHPDVIALREQIDQMRRQRQAERAGLAGAGMEGVANASNPVYQSAQIALNESSVKIAGLRSQVDQHQAIVDSLNSQINTIPEVEAELATLTRDYDQYRSLYSEIMLQKERERMGKIGDERDVVTFNITEPPAATLEPVAPKRSVLIVGVLILGISAGGGLAFLLNQLQPIVHDVMALRRLAARPVLGSVSINAPAGTGRYGRVAVAWYAAATAALVLVFCASLVFQDPLVATLRSMLTEIRT